MIIFFAEGKLEQTVPPQQSWSPGEAQGMGASAAMSQLRPGCLFPSRAPPAAPAPTLLRDPPGQRQLSPARGSGAAPRGC